MATPLPPHFPPVLIVVVWVIQFAVTLSFFHKIMLARSARHFARGSRRNKDTHSFSAQDECQIREVEPSKVCIQLPLYNEPRHARPLLEHVYKIDYPDELLEVQVLDDSTDTTSGIVAETIGLLRETRPFLKVSHVQRASRSGYKAGALNHGLALSDADYFAVFDCDFRPRPDFLKRIVREFSKNRSPSPKHNFEEIVCVQAGWAYYNDSESLFTRCQAQLLNTHFYMEHAGRSARNLVFNFNGTAGVWRRSWLVESGGWSDHSVTEDLYLSYQSYLSGRRLLFCSDLSCDSELPSDLASFLVQQRRWAKGNGQVLRLLGRNILFSKDWSLSRKADVGFHLFGYGLTSLVLLALALAPIWLTQRALWISQTSFVDSFRVLDSALWLALWGTLTSVYSSHAAHFSSTAPIPRWLLRIQRSLFLLLIAPCLSMLLCRSYWEGVLLPARGQQLIFKRTPKLGHYHSKLCYSDHFAVLGLILYFLALSALSLHHNFHLAALLLLAHAVAILFLWVAYGMVFPFRLESKECVSVKVDPRRFVSKGLVK